MKPTAINFPEIMKYPLLLRFLQYIATLASGVGKRKKLFILIYHRVLDAPDYMRPQEVDIESFDWQMALLSKYFNVLTLEDGLQRLQNDSLPARAVCITFDDGYADNFTNALPILQRYKLNATFFIASGFLDGGRMWNDTIIEAVRNMQDSILDLSELGLGKFDVSDKSSKNQSVREVIQKIKHLPFDQRKNYVEYIASVSQNLPEDLMMTSEQVKKLDQSGMTIGGHTVNHPILSSIDLNMAESEVLENKKHLEQLINKNVKFFAYPNGKPEIDYRENHAQIVKQNGYLGAVSTQWGVASKVSDPWQLPRFIPWDKVPHKFMLRMCRLYCA
ncbi:polysaccharide deacetylase family protein [Methylomonas methanica]|nr:polysaccharide deacetylase family protein [Methylomonas methanica]